MEDFPQLGFPTKVILRNRSAMPCVPVVVESVGGVYFYLSGLILPQAKAIPGYPHSNRVTQGCFCNHFYLFARQTAHLHEQGTVFAVQQRLDGCFLPFLEFAE